MYCIYQKIKMSCTHHKDCSSKEYCVENGICSPFAECFAMQDGIGGKCPDLARSPKEHCGGCETVEYCKNSGCYCAADTCYPQKIAGEDICTDQLLLTSLGFPECN